MGQVRILGGVWRGRVLAVPASVRPATARVREAVFSMLETRGALAEARVLDCFAGSGALGLEALSRGASHADFLELRPKVLEQNLARFCEVAGSPVACLVGRNALKPPVPAMGLPAQLVFADPPWRAAESLYGACFRALEAQGWLDGATLLVAFQRRAQGAGGQARTAKDRAESPPLRSTPCSTIEMVERRQVGDGEIVFSRVAQKSPQKVV